MNMSPEADADVMELTTNELVSKGYKIFLRPSDAQLPRELKGVRPDAIAIGKKPYLVIQVANEGKGPERANKIRQALEGNSDWKLHLVVDRGLASAPLGTEPIASIESVLREVPTVADDDTRAALLMCWASFEAIARLVEPSIFARPQTPGRIIETLAELAYIVPSDADWLRGLVSKRNDFIHGMLSVAVTNDEVARFVSLLNGLIEAAKNKFEPAT